MTIKIQMLTLGAILLMKIFIIKYVPINVHLTHYSMMRIFINFFHNFTYPAI